MGDQWITVRRWMSCIKRFKRICVWTSTSLPSAHRCFFQLRQLRRVRRSLATLVHAFVTSRIDYCNGLLDGALKVVTDNLQRVMNAAARIVYCCLDGQAPRYLADHLITSSYVASRLRLCSANRHQLIVPRCRLNTYGRRAFSIAGPTVWNALPDELRDLACGSDSFKQFLKTILFSLY